MPVLETLITMVSGVQVIYDLLERSSGHLELREDPDQGITVAGLKRIKVSFCGFNARFVSDWYSNQES